MNFENKQTHQTVLGGLITLTVSIFFFIFFSRSMLRPNLFYLKDTVSTTSIIWGFQNPQPAEALAKGNETRFSFTLYVNNDTFDNDDNPYGTFIMH